MSVYCVQIVVVIARMVHIYQVVEMDTLEFVQIVVDRVQLESILHHVED